MLYLIAAGKHDGMEFIDEHLSDAEDFDEGDSDAIHSGPRTKHPHEGGGSAYQTEDDLSEYERKFNLHHGKNSSINSNSSSSSSADNRHQRPKNKNRRSRRSDDEDDDEDDIQAGFNTEERLLLFNDNHLLGEGPSVMEDGKSGGKRKDRNKIDVIMFEKAQHPQFHQRIIRELCDRRGYSIAFASFIVAMLQIDPRARPTADELLKRIHRVGTYEYRII